MRRVRWWRRDHIFYGFCAGGILGAVGILGLLLINFGLARYEQMPPDAPVSAYDHGGAPIPIVRDTFSTTTEAPAKSSAPRQKIAPASRLRAPRPHKTKTTAPATATGTTTGSGAKPSPRPAPVPTTPLPVPVVTVAPPGSITVPLPLIPPITVTVPGLPRVSTGN